MLDGIRCKKGLRKQSPFQFITSVTWDENSGFHLNIDTFGAEQFLKFTGLVHLADDVAATQELTLDVELGDRRPTAELLDAFAQARVGEHVDALELDAKVGQHLHHGRRETALREHRRALHVKDDVVGLDVALDPLFYGVIHHSISSSKRPAGARSSVFRNRSLQSESMKLSAHAALQSIIDHFVLLNARLAFEGHGLDISGIMVAITTQVLDPHIGIGNAFLDQALDESSVHRHFQPSRSARELIPDYLPYIRAAKPHGPS